MWKFIPSLQSSLVLLAVLSFLPFWVICDEIPLAKSPPFYNLIPRFKIPRGNLLHYRIPQWEVLYFLKYGVVPFIFYDPNFNRTNFVSQARKFKMYFEDGREIARPNRTVQMTAQDEEESFREFLKMHGYTNYTQFLPKGFGSQNDQMTEEMEGLLRDTTTEEGLLTESIDQEDIETPLETETTTSGKDPRKSFPFNFLFDKTPLNPVQSGESTTKAEKRAETMDRRDERNYQSFRQTFVNRYPYPYHRKLQEGIKGMKQFVGNHDPTWKRRVGPQRTRTLLDFNLDPSAHRVSLRNGDANTRDTVVRKAGKDFQTQGW